MVFYISLNLFNDLAISEYDTLLLAPDFTGMSFMSPPMDFWNFSIDDLVSLMVTVSFMVFFIFQEFRELIRAAAAVCQDPATGHLTTPFFCRVEHPFPCLLSSDNLSNIRSI